MSNDQTANGEPEDDTADHKPSAAKALGDGIAANLANGTGTESSQLPNGTDGANAIDTEPEDSVQPGIDLIGSEAGIEEIRRRDRLHRHAGLAAAGVLLTAAAIGVRHLLGRRRSQAKTPVSPSSAMHRLRSLIKP